MRDKQPKDHHPFSLRLEKDVREKLRALSDKTGLAERTLAQMAIEAAVEAAEKAGGRVVVPFDFEVTHEAKPADRAAEEAADYGGARGADDSRK